MVKYYGRIIIDLSATDMHSIAHHIHNSVDLDARKPARLG